MKNLNKVVLLLAITSITFSCKKNSTEPEEETVEQTTPTDNLTKMGETYITGANTKAVIYSAKAFETGYNEVFVALYDSTDGTRLSNGHFTVTPMMDMGTMTHSCPVENTTDSVTTNGYFKSAIVFSMPGTSSQWSLNFTFQNKKNGLTGTGSAGVTVISSSPSRFKSTTVPLDNNDKVFISLVNLKTPQVGVNDFEITLHKKGAMNSFPAINNYSVEIVPEMPSMGHGSPNNVNPVLTSNGHYAGKVNFTMTGLWRINVNLYLNGTLISNDQYFETTLQ